MGINLSQANSRLITHSNHLLYVVTDYLPLGLSCPQSLLDSQMLFFCKTTQYPRHIH